MGCCNPARAWQRGPPLNPPSPAPEIDDKVLFDHVMRKPNSPIRTKLIGRPASTAVQSADQSLVDQQVRAYDQFASGDPHIAYALVVGGMSGELTSLHINMTSGAVLRKVPVPGYNNWELATRDFAWDPKRALFYALDVNFTGSGANRPASGRPIILSKIDPVAGKVDAVAVAGVTDYVTGYAYHEASGRIHAASRSYGGSDSSSQPTGSTFFFVDPDTGKAEVQGTLSLTGKESDPATYGGYHRGVDAEGQTAFRLGYASVVMQASPGLGRVYSGGKADWTPMSSVDQEHEWYLGMLTLNGGKSALSVAPVSATGFLDLVSWDVPDASTGKSASSPKVYSLGNVTGPGIGIPGHAGTIGYVLDAVRESDTTWAGLVVVPNPIPIPFPHALDAWGIAKVNYKTGKVSVSKLTSPILSGGTSISGLGLPSL